MPNKKYLPFGIIILQLFFLSGMIWFHDSTLRQATRIVLKTVPLDPMSMFRGRYVSLRYEISSLPVSLLKGSGASDLKSGDEIFVALQKKGDLWQAQGIYRKVPPASSGIFIRGRVPFYNSSWYGHNSTIDVAYGIESFFLNEKSADEVDRAANRQVFTWQRREEQRKEFIAQLDEETRRIEKSGIKDHWFKILQKELDIWLKEGLIEEKSKDAIAAKYSGALAKLEEAEKKLGAVQSQNQKSVVVEVAVDRKGNAYPTQLFSEGKVYK
jgi:uncharacterized membrane-anchored protein